MTPSAQAMLEGPLEERAVAQPLRSLFGRWFFRAVRWLLGTLLCQSLVGAILVVGWTQRWVRRSVLSRWPTIPPDGNGRAESASPDSTEGATPIEATSVGAGRWVRARLGAMVSTFGLGASSLLATGVLMAPAQILWAFSWHAGWNTSFSKVYEQSEVGLLTGLAGVGLFLLAVPLLSMAQARHAVSEEWRSALDLPILRRLSGERPWATLGLALGYLLASLPMTALVIAPAFFGQELEGSVAEIRQVAVRYWWVVTAIGLTLYLPLRWASGWVYSRALRSAALAGRLDRRSLHGEEIRLLQRLPLTSSPPQRPIRFRRWFRLPLFGLVALVWFGFVGQIYVAAFFNDRGPRQWLNQPLIELPWWRAIPGHLQSGAE